MKRIDYAVMAVGLALLLLFLQHLDGLAAALRPARPHRVAAGDVLC